MNLTSKKVITYKRTQDLSFAFTNMEIEMFCIRNMNIKTEYVNTYFEIQVIFRKTVDSKFFLHTVNWKIC